MESRAPRYVKATVRRKFLASHWNCCANGSSLQFSRLTRISIPQWRRSSLQHSISNGKRRRRPEGCSVYANPQCARRRLRQDQCQRSSGACIIGLSTSNVEMNAGATDLIRMPGCLSCFFQVVRRQRGKASVLDWATHSEMVEALPIARRDAEHLVNRIIEVAADPGRPNSRLFRLEVQHLANEAGLPEEISVEARAIDNQTVHVLAPSPAMCCPQETVAARVRQSPSFSRESGRPCGHEAGRCHRKSGRIACRSVSTFSGSRAST